jgi:hypothetical protein
MGFGTNTSFDTLAYARNTTVAQFGMDRAFDAIETALEAHNEQVDEMLKLLAEPSTDQLRAYGGPDSMAMEELDEFGTPQAQKVTAGVNVGFPCKRYGAGLQWTRLWFRNKMASELAAQVTGLMDADFKLIQRELKKSLFLSANYTFIDRLHPKKLSLPVKRLVNADSQAIPLAPDGTSFTASTHTHYLGYGSSSYAAADLTAGIATVNEHFLSGEVMVLINVAQEIATRAFTGFTALLPGSIIPSVNSNQVRGTLDVYNTTNRWIGDFNGSPVWVKPWIPSGYVLFLHIGAEDKVLVNRTIQEGSGLELMYELDEYPLYSKSMDREIGFGVWNRVGAAVLDIAHSTYNDPTIS